MFFKKKQITEFNGSSNKKGVSKSVLIVLSLLLVGGSITGYSYIKIQNYIKPKVVEETIMVPVTNGPISVYSKISASDFRMQPFPKGTDTSDFVMDPKKAEGKIAATRLPAYQPVSKGDLIEPYQVSADVRELSIYMDPARSDSAKPGDYVDIYRISNDPNTPAVKVAENVLIIDVCDSSGQSIYEKESVKAAIVEAVKGGNGTIYKILVNKQDVSKVIPGSSPKNAFYSFSRCLNKKEE